jgi:CheY-like chemotaxis protein
MVHARFEMQSAGHASRPCSGRPIRTYDVNIRFCRATVPQRLQDLLCGSWKAAVPSSLRISVVDDDESMREALKSLLKSAGFNAEAFASAEEFLNSTRLSRSACLVVDVRMPGMSGIDLQDRLIASGCEVPIILISAHGDEEARARALENGAVAFLQKPFTDEALLNAIAAAVG